MNIIRLWALLRRLMLALTLALPLAATAAPQQTFATPEAAVDALMAALKADSDASMLAIFGDDYKHLIVQDDRAAASANRAKIYTSMQTLRVLRESGPDRRLLLIGDEAWPMPIPIVRSGRSLALCQRVGRGRAHQPPHRCQRTQCHLCAARVRRCAARVCGASTATATACCQYAQKLASTPGKRDGLYWTADAAKGEEMSPFGPLIAESAAYLEGHAAGRPLPRLSLQDPDAPGRACRRAAPTTTSSTAA